MTMYIYKYTVTFLAPKMCDIVNRSQKAARDSPQFEILGHVIVNAKVIDVPDAFTAKP